MNSTPPPLAPYLMLAPFAEYLGETPSKANRLRVGGRIPEAEKLGRYYVIPADKAAEIKARLLAAGLIGGPRA